MKPSNAVVLGVVLTFVLLSAALGLYWSANRYEYMQMGLYKVPVRINRFTQKTEIWKPTGGWQSHE